MLKSKKHENENGQSDDSIQTLTIESAPAPRKPTRVFQDNQPNGFAMLMQMPNTSEFLAQQGYQELPGAFSIVKSYVSETLQLKFAVVVSYEDEDCVFLLREYQYPEFMRKYSMLAGILRGYLPSMEYQQVMKPLP